MMFCQHCGNPLPANALSCPTCGAPVTNNTSYNQAPPPPAYGQPGYTQAPYQQGYYQEPYSQTNPNDKSSFGFAFLGFLIPLVGFVLYLVWKDDMPKKAKSAGRGALTKIILYFLLVVLTIVLSFFFAVSYPDLFEEFSDLSYMAISVLL